MRIGAQLQTHGVEPHMLVEHAVGLVAEGVDSLWVWDHLVPFTRQPPAIAWEAWSMLGALALALRGSSVSLGVLVSPLTFRDPVLLARSAATTARLRDGKVVLAVGAGGYVHDDRLAGTSMTTGERMRRLLDGVSRLRPLLDESKNAAASDVDLWVGGDGEHVTIPTAARFADGWSGFGPPERFEGRRRLLDSELVRCGRDIGAVHASVLTTRHDSGVPLSRWRRAGADEVIVSLAPDGSGGFDTTALRTLLSQRP